ncbi:hypothetical protein [Flavobacterium sp.]|uniref:hypothetical protein n=1 Tax=Flavobacterium sp. TaxID=239 RepID=UPI0025BD9677|nr:hypothetical protein [Flavobacterium sp.]|tara:strand:+ start:723 stop:893 length:171 start_codon:yes stop_codon:yes gene_type:complete
MIVEQLRYPDEFSPFIHQLYFKNTNKVVLYRDFESTKIYQNSVGVWKPKLILNKKS